MISQNFSNGVQSLQVILVMEILSMSKGLYKAMHVQVWQEL